MLGRLTGISYNGTLRHEYRYSATANDGRITSYKNWQSGEDVEYQYDSLGRLAQAQTVGPQWGQAFSYDGFGNLVAKSVTKGSAPVLNVTASASTNRLNVSGMTYDANGNVTAMPGVGAMTYDGRNRYNGAVAWSTPPDRGYDPSNRRIWRKVGDEIEVDFFLPGGEKLGTYATFLHNGHGQDGSNGAEGCQKATNNPGQKYCIGFAAVKTNYYFGGRLVKLQVGVWPTWYQADRLGSHGQHHPYGERRSGTTWQDPGFATYWRESSGLDYAVNRHYSSTFGRFTSADPYRASAEGANNPSDPATWNRYSYSGNDPVNKVDPLGTSWWWASSLEMHDFFGAGGGFGCNVLGWAPGTFCQLQVDLTVALLFAQTPGEGGEPECEIHVKYRAIEQFPAANHAYVETRDANGTVKHLEGGPEFNNPTIEILYQHIPTRIPGRPTIPVPVGIRLDFGLLVKRNDYSHSSSDSSLWTRIGAEWCNVAQIVKTTYDQYRPTVPYSLTGPNSNSFVSYLLGTAGISVSTGLTILPGWGALVH